MDIEKLLLDEQARRAPAKKIPALEAMQRDFKVLQEDRYEMRIPELAITIQIDRLRRDHHELIGELSVLCDLPGTYAVEGSLSVADMNLSSARTRVERAKLLGSRANIPSLDWIAIIEEFCQRVLRAERVGQPAVDLRSITKPPKDDSLQVKGLRLPRRHPSILFGDGGSGKSYLALFLAGSLVIEDGMNVALFDWELAGEDHRERLERLFPDGMPRIVYARCERPLVYEVDRLRRIVQGNQIDYIVFDSVAFACDGPPEAAEVAGRYFRAVREIGCGSLHVAHMNKSDAGDQKPFGSVFWNNGARSTWYTQRAEELPDGSIFRLGLFNRKANLGPLQQPLGFTVTFTEDMTYFRRSDVAENAELAEKMTMRQRMVNLLRKGDMSHEELAEEMGKEVDVVKRTVRRYKKQFTVLEGGRVGLLARGT